LAEGELVMFADGQPAQRTLIPIPEEIRRRNAARVEAGLITV
jgi:hypothetical protein